MNRMVRFVPMVILASALFATAESPARAHAPQQNTRADATSIAGKWTSRVHASTLSFDLKLDGQKVTGTFSTDQSGALPLTGEYVDGRLSFTVAARSEIGFTGRLKDPDTLVGDLSTQNGDMACTATRVRQ
jgi:hypothetical protein